MAENRDEILANFQACTGIEDVEIALSQLEDTNWDLMRAVNRAIPDESHNRTNDSSPDIEMIQEIPNSRIVRAFPLPGQLVQDPEYDDVVVCSDVPESSNTQNNWRDMPSLPSTSNTAAKTLRLTVVQEGEGPRHLVELPSSASVLDLKKRLVVMTGIPACRQALTGWRRAPRSDDTALASLGVGPDTRLHVYNTSKDGHVGDDMVDRLSQEFTLEVTNVSEGSGKLFTLKYPGSKAILDVKTDLFELTNIPMRHQLWTGWPDPPPADATPLGLAGLQLPAHSFTVRSREPAKPRPEPKKTRRVQHIDDSDESSLEEFEDAAETFTGDEDLFIPDSITRKLRPLIPDKVEDETVGCLHFADEFSSRYGPIHPEFFPGSLDEAIKEACMKPARERRLLALYLHHDKSVLSNVFCAQLLCQDSVIQILAAYFVLWGWDLTFVDNQTKFINSLTNGIGAIGAMQIKNIPVERLPAIIIISRVRSGIEIMSVIQGNVGVNELMASVSETVDVFLAQQTVEVREEEERAAREMIMTQQDAAFRESLEMDRAKEEARKQQEAVESQEKQREQQLRDEEAKQKEAERLAVESRLPAEPPEAASGVTKIRVRVPKGEFLERRFRETDALQTLLDWLHVQGYSSAEFKLLSSWPRRDLTSAQDQLTRSLLHHKLCPQETVILQERRRFAVKLRDVCVEMSEPDWANLPSVVLYDLYHVLDLHDRIAASASCKRWREAFYFYPNWRRALSITYVADEWGEVASLLEDWTCSQRVTELQLVGCGEPPSTFPSQFSKTVYPFLESSLHLSTLVLYHFADLERLNAVLSKHKATLVTLGLGTLAPSPETDIPPALTLSGLEQLEVLQLDGVWVTHQLVVWIGQHLSRLKILSLFLRKDNTVGDIPAETWALFANKLPGCGVRLTYSRMEDESDQVHAMAHHHSSILTKAPNVTHLRMVHCSRDFQERCVNALMGQRPLLHTLRCIWSVVDEAKRDVFIRHPFVVCSWRFKHLTEMILSGSMFDDYDLVGMHRMRPSLRLRIAKEDIASGSSGASGRAINHDELQRLINDLSTPNAPWSPMDSRCLNDPALPSRDREARILHCILSGDYHSPLSRPIAN